MKILCTGDIHIGRRSSRIPARFNGHSYSSAAAWEAVVDCAITERVDIVALSGDVVDRDNRYFEAYGPLEGGLRRLADAGIDTYAVAGNHDFDVLPQLTRSLGSDRFHLLGQGGAWQRMTIARDGQPALHIDGWSFPQEAVRTNPLDSYDLPAVANVPVLGLLHADFGAAVSRYAPVSRADLDRRPATVWLLGHIHAPARIQLTGERFAFYPGSPQAMDPGEPGAHGPWIIEIDAAGSVTARQVAGSRVRYERVEIDLTGVEDESVPREMVAEAVRKQLVEIVQEEDAGLLECLCCRVVLRGRTSLHRRLPGLLGGEVEHLAIPVDRVTGVVEKLEFETGPAVDLDQLAASNDPPGEIARMLIALSQDGDTPPEYQPLITRTMGQLRRMHQASAFVTVASDPEPDRELAIRHLWAEGMSLLDALLAQKETT